jgi:hypothetical protein
MRISEIERKVFIDLDGCLADCAKGAADFNHLTLEEFESYGWNNKYWSNVINNGDIKKFFANLEWMPNGKKLLAWFDNRKIPYIFLSRPVGPPNTEECIAGKKLWLKKNGLGGIPAIFAFNKDEYVGNSNILIDDLDDNIKSWNVAGGIGILYEDSGVKNTFKKLSKIFSKNISEEVKIDNKRGAGATPNNEDIDYFGLRVAMKPSSFLSLTPSFSHFSDSVDNMREYIKNGNSIGSPFLSIQIPSNWEDLNFRSAAKVIDHEGRHRMLGVLQVYGDIPIETHLFLKNYRRKNIAPEWILQINKELYSQEGDLILGPFFHKYN